MNWIGSCSEPKRQPKEATAGVKADALLIGGDNYHFLLDSSRGVGCAPTPVALSLAAATHLLHLLLVGAGGGDAQSLRVR